MGMIDDWKDKKKMKTQAKKEAMTEIKDEMKEIYKKKEIEKLKKEGDSNFMDKCAKLFTSSDAKGFINNSDLKLYVNGGDFIGVANGCRLLLLSSVNDGNLNLNLNGGSIEANPSFTGRSITSQNGGNIKLTVSQTRLDSIYYVTPSAADTTGVFMLSGEMKGEGFIYSEGNSDYTVGKKVKLTINELKNITSDMSDDDIKNKMLSGYYIITAIAHKFDGRAHTCKMELMKDSVVST